MKKHLLKVMSSVFALLFVTSAWAAPVAQWTNFTGLTADTPLASNSYPLALVGGIVNDDGTYTTGGDGLAITLPATMANISIAVECELPADASGTLISLNLAANQVSSYWDATNKQLQQWWNTGLYGNDAGKSAAFTTAPTRIVLAYTSGSTGTQTLADGISAINSQTALKGGDVVTVRIGTRLVGSNALAGAKIKAIYIYDSRLTAWPAEIVIPAPENPGIIGLNFASGQASMSSLTQTDMLGFKTDTKGGEIAISAWNQLSGASGTPTVTDAAVNSYKLSFSSPNVYHANNATDTAVEKLIYGYLDSNGANKVSVSLAGLPTSGYDVAVIASGDNDSGAPKFAPFTVNGEQYTAVDNLTARGSTGWGTRNGTLTELAEGTNVLYIPAQRDSVLTIEGSNTNGRGSLAAVMVFPKAIVSNTATATENTAYSNLTWDDGSAPTATEVAAITLADGVTLTIDETVTATTLDIVCEGNCTIAMGENGSFGTTMVSYDGVTGTVTYAYPVDAISPSTKFIYDGGAGSAETAASVASSGGTINLTGGTFYLPGDAAVSGNNTTVNVTDDAKIVTTQVGVGTATWNVSDNAQIETARFILSQGAAGRAAKFNLSGNAAVTVTGTSNVDSNQASIMFGHWNGSSTYTQTGGTFTAEGADVLIGKTGNTHTINIAGGVFNVHGIKVAGNGGGSNTLNLSGGEMKIGASGITVYGNRLNVNVTGDAKITSTAAMTISQPMALSEGKVLTLDATAGDITLTGAISGAGAINVIGGTVDMSALTTIPTIAGVAEGATLKLPSDAGLLSMKLSGGAPVATIPTATDAVISGTVYVDGHEATVSTADGVTTATSNETVTANPTLTGSDWLWDYEFNGSNASTGSNTGTVTLEGSATGYTTADADGNQAIYFQKTPWRDTSYGTEYTAVMRAMPGNYADTALVGFGTLSGNAIILATGETPAEGQMRLYLWQGASATANATDNLTALGGDLIVANATTAYHTYAFTLSVVDNKTRIAVYVDGKRKAIYEHDSVIQLGGGFQMGSLHGGVKGINDDLRDTGLTKYVASGDSGSLDFLRTVNEKLSGDAIKAIADAYPYVSSNGLATRTVTATDTTWISADGMPWSQTVGETTTAQAAPNNGTMIALDATEDTTLAMNVTEDVSYESMTVTGSGAVTLTTGDHHVTASDLTVSTDLTVDAENFKIGTLFVSADTTLTLDISSLLAKAPYLAQEVTTGLVQLENDTAKVVISPTTDETHGRTVAFEFDTHSNTYKLSITPPAEGYKAVVPAEGKAFSELTWVADDTGIDADLVLVADAEGATLTLDEAVSIPTVAVTGGTLTLAGDNALTATTLTANVNIVTPSANLAVGALNIAQDVSVTVDVAADTTFNACNITGAGTLVKKGAGEIAFSTSGKTNKKFLDGGAIRVLNGTLHLSGDDGDVELNNATLSFGKDPDVADAAPALTNYAFVKIPGETLTVHVDEDVTVDSSVVFWNNGSSIKKTGKGTFGFALNGNENSYKAKDTVIEDGTLIFNGSDTFTGVISGAGALWTTGSTTLMAANTYQGGTVVKTGTLKIAGVEDSTEVLPLGKTVNVEAGATLELSKGISYAKVEGAGTTSVPADGTFSFGRGDAGGDIATDLAVAGTLTLRAWSSYGGLTFNPKSVTVSGTIQKAEGLNEVPTLKTSSISGTGTVSVNLEFAAGATLDTTVALPTFAKTVTLGDALTVKVASVTDAAILTATEGVSGTPTAKAIIVNGEDKTTDYALAVKDGALYIVESGTIDVNGKKYKTFAEAIAAVATDGTETTISVTEAMDISETGLTLLEGQNVVLDLAGQTITAANTVAGNIDVPAGATLTVKDSIGTGKLTTNTPYSADAKYGLVEVFGTFNMVGGTINTVFKDDTVNQGQFAVVVKGTGTVNVSGGTIEAGWYAISGNNLLTNGATVTLTGGTLKSTIDYALYLPHVGTTTISGDATTIQGAAGAIAQNAGTLTINGGYISSLGTGDTGEWGDGTGDLVNAAVNVEAKYGATNTALNGGTFDARENAIALVVSTNPSTVTKAATLEIAAPEGYEWVDGTTLAPLPTTAEVASEDELLAALAKDSITTITVTGDFAIAGTATLAKGKTLVIPAGKTVTAEATANLYIQGDITVEGILNGNALLYGETGLVANQGGKVNIAATGHVVMPKVWEGHDVNPADSPVVGVCTNGAKITIGDAEEWNYTNGAWVKESNESIQDKIDAATSGVIDTGDATITVAEDGTITVGDETVTAPADKPYYSLAVTEGKLSLVLNDNAKPVIAATEDESIPALEVTADGLKINVPSLESALKYQLMGTISLDADKVEWKPVGEAVTGQASHTFTGGTTYKFFKIEVTDK